MSATEVYIVPFKMMSIKFDKALIKKVPFTDIEQRKLSKIEFRRIQNNELICDVDCQSGGINFYNNSFPASNNINVVKGITEMVIQ